MAQQLQQHQPTHQPKPHTFKFCRSSLCCTTTSGNTVSELSANATRTTSSSKIIHTTSSSPILAAYCSCCMQLLTVHFSSTLQKGAAVCWVFRNTCKLSASQFWEYLYLAQRCARQHWYTVRCGFRAYLQPVSRCHEVILLVPAKFGHKWPQTIFILLTDCI